MGIDFSTIQGSFLSASSGVTKRRFASKNNVGSYKKGDG